jgi:tRNA-splicing ligase RtcB
MERITSKLVNWASILDPKTKAQAIESSAMEFIQPYLALMPDAHLGKGATVGSVIPTVGAIMPAAVGVDIGCGMNAVLTQFRASDLDGLDLRSLHAQIGRSIPLSAGGANQRQPRTAAARIADLEAMPGADQAERAMPRWRPQLGSLGSGNHFIEVSLDEDDQVWFFLHSGSRGVGNRLASRHIEVAQRVCADNGVRLPNRDLAFLTEGTDEFAAYIEALNWAQHFALLNRAEMMDRVADQFERWIGIPVQRLEDIRCHHNYTERMDLPDPGEPGTVRATWLSRKGAISARAGQLGLIPGSMGDRSYVVAGRGDPRSFQSAPHGAGRVHSRGSARRTFARADLDRRMGGIVWGESDAFLDEHPSAYKDIDVVMRDAGDLVDVVHELRQVVNVKGN